MIVQDQGDRGGDFGASIRKYFHAKKRKTHSIRSNLRDSSD